MGNNPLKQPVKHETESESHMMFFGLSIKTCLTRPLDVLIGDILVRQKGGICSSEQGSDFCPLTSHMQVSPCFHVI